jgi:hypothetical protein
MGCRLAYFKKSEAGAKLRFLMAGKVSFLGMLKYLQHNYFVVLINLLP